MKMQEIDKNNGKIHRLIMMSCLLVFLWSGCTSEFTHENTGEVKTTFGLTATSALLGKITIRDAYLKLDHIEVQGMFAGQRLAALSHDIRPDDPPFRLTRADSSYVTFAMPETPYDQIIYDLYLFQDNYQLIPIADPQEAPSPSPAPDNNGGSQGNGNNGQPDGTPPPGNDNTEDKNSDDQNDGDDNNDAEDEEGDEEDIDDNDNVDEDDEDDRDEDDDKAEKKNKEKKKKNKQNKGKKNNKKNDSSRTTETSNAQLVDLDHFFQNAKPALVVFGTYNNNARSLTILFVVTGMNRFTVRSPENENIILTSQIFARVEFDVEQLFTSITTTDIESAQRQIYQGQEVLFIHRDINSILYGKLLSRLESSARLTFRSSPTP